MTVVANVAAIIATLHQELRVLHADLTHRQGDPQPGEAALPDAAYVDPLHDRD